MPSPETAAGPLNILVVEDTPGAFDLIERALQAAGLNFCSRRIDAPEALSGELDRQHPHVVLCDHGTARIDSFYVLDVVRARSRSLPFIVVTGGALPEVQLTDALTRGADDVVPRHRLGELGPAVQRALRLGDARQRLAEAEEERDRLRAELDAWRLGRPRLPTPLPICAGCKKIRDSHNVWIQLENYLLAHLNIRFSHGLCSDCVRKYHDGLA